MPNFDACRTCKSRLYRNAPFRPRDQTGRRCGRCEDGSMWSPMRTLEPPTRPVDILCRDCPIHLEEGMYPGITRMGGKPLHCPPTKKASGNGCYDQSKRSQKVKLYRAILAKHDVLVDVGKTATIEAEV